MHMLRTMNDPACIGPAMAVALITTFYGRTPRYAPPGAEPRLE